MIFTGLSQLQKFKPHEMLFFLPQIIVIKNNQKIFTYKKVNDLLHSYILFLDNFLPYNYFLNSIQLFLDYKTIIQLVIECSSFTNDINTSFFEAIQNYLMFDFNTVKCANKTKSVIWF